MRIHYFIVKNLERGGGIEKYTAEVGGRLVKKGHEVTVYSMSHYGDVPSEYGGMRVVRVPSLPISAGEKLLSSAMAAFSSLFRGKPDIAHFHSVAAGAFAPFMRVRGVPCVLQMHGIEWQRSRWGGVGSRVLYGLEWFSMHCANAATAVSQKQCVYLAEQYGKPCRFISTGADIPDPMPPQEIVELGLAPMCYILFASRLVREKGAHYLIPAYRKLATDVKLVIAGDAAGEEAYKEELRKLAGDDPRILFVGFVGGRLLAELFTHAAVYAQPSEIEGLSLSLLEAMGYGLPCVASNIPENIEAIGEHGYSFANKSIQDLALRLQWVLEHPEDARVMGQNARERVARHFSWDGVADEVERLYQSVLAGES